MVQADTFLVGVTKSIRRVDGRADIGNAVRRGAELIGSFGRSADIANVAGGKRGGRKVFDDIRGDRVRPRLQYEIAEFRSPYGGRSGARAALPHRLVGNEE